jgi:hypothetical protein
LQIFICVADGPEEKAGIGLTGHEGGAGVSAGEESLPGIHSEASLDTFGLGAMAFIAGLREDGADFVFEELQVGGIQGRRGR